ncbi:MAG: serine hydroxymethyltransferase [Phycisphaerae bacterium]|nr:serine hydroxymethyltransferase [Phycisphaerae bacterium]
MAHDVLAQTVHSLLDHRDPQVASLVRQEARRQAETLELIASENHASGAVMAAMGTCLTNKYAEGYPGARYYGGCGFYDQIEEIARHRARQLFNCAFANVQPHSGATANQALFLALLDPGDTFASLVLADGGHLTHGLKVNMSGKWFKPVHYPLVYDASSPEFERIDYDAMEKICVRAKPKLIMCGYSAYPRVIDFARFRRVADRCGAILHADIAHIAGLVATGVHPSPFPHCHVVTTTTHKTLRGPRGGMILCNDEEMARKIDRAVFPGVLGGPLMNTIAAKAVAFGEALKPEFKEYSGRIVTNARALVGALAERGYRITTGGTDTHLMLVDLRRKSEQLTGADAEKWLEGAGIVCNKNGVPQDPRPPKLTSGVRLGTPALTTRGMGEAEMGVVAGLIDRVVSAGLRGSHELAIESAGVVEQIRHLCHRFPLPA